VTETDGAALAQPSVSLAAGPAAGPAVGPAVGPGVTRLALTDFRCYRGLRLTVDARPAVLTGPNGAGKTNLLEAISFLAPGRGLRRAKLGDCDRIGAATGPWAVAATLATPLGPVDIGTGREPAGQEGERRVVRIAGETRRGQAALAEYVSIAWLTPQMDRLFMEGAGPRRRFLDRLVFGFDPGHARRLAAYDHGLRERAQLLAEGARDATWLAALEDGMARDGVAVAAARREQVERLNRAQDLRHGPFPAADLALKGTVEAWLGEMPALAAEDRLRALLADSRRRDAEAGGAADGPHRTDLVARHLIKGRPAAQCSTGEQKAMLIAIVLADARLQAEARGSAPILLLDEVAAHLDEARRRALFDELLALGGQAWLTGTDAALFEPLGTRAQHFRVFDATIHPA
jgi:DNA replication and repair protein RecF